MVRWAVRAIVALAAIASGRLAERAHGGEDCPTQPTQLPTKGARGADYALLQRSTRVKLTGPPLEDLLQAQQTDLDQQVQPIQAQDFPELPALQSSAALSGPAPAWEDTGSRSLQGVASQGFEGAGYGGQAQAAALTQGLAQQVQSPTWQSAAFQQPAVPSQAAGAQLAGLASEQLGSSTALGQLDAQKAAGTQLVGLAQEQVASGTALGRLNAQLAGVSTAATALERAALQITQLQVQLQSQRRLALVAEQKVAQDEQYLQRSQQSLRRAEGVQQQLQKQQQERVAKYEQKLRDDASKLEASQQKLEESEAGRQRLQETLAQSEATAKKLQKELQERSKQVELNELTLQESQREREQALKALQQRSELLGSNQQLLQKGEAQLTKAAEQLQASTGKISALQSQLASEKEALAYVEGKAAQDARKLSASEALRKEAELRLQVVSLQDAQKLNASEAKLLREEQRLQAMAQRLSAMELQADAHPGIEARLNSSLAMNRRLQLTLAQEVSEIKQKESELSQLQRRSHSVKLMPWADILERCKDVCFVLAHSDACCGGSSSSMAQRPKSCLTATKIAAGQELAPSGCSDVLSPAPSATMLQSAVGIPADFALAADSSLAGTLQSGAGGLTSSAFTAGGDAALVAADPAPLPQLSPELLGMQLAGAGFGLSQPSAGPADLYSSPAALSAALPQETASYGVSSPQLPYAADSLAQLGLSDAGLAPDGLSASGAALASPAAAAGAAGLGY